MARRKPPSPGPYLMHAELVRERIPDLHQFPYTLPAIHSLERLAFHPKVTFFVGENGSGKSTLLEALAIECGLNPEGGSRNFNFVTYSLHVQQYFVVFLSQQQTLQTSNHLNRSSIEFCI